VTTPFRIAVVNGPNLNLTGTREPAVYGTQRFEDVLPAWQARFPAVGISYFQSNVEGELINHLHSLMGAAHGIVLNAGAYAHTSIALGDAVAAVALPVVEVHLSNIFAREDFRRASTIAARCIGSISGFGMESYALAIQALLVRFQEGR